MWYGNRALPRFGRGSFDRSGLFTRTALATGVIAVGRGFRRPAALARR